LKKSVPMTVRGGKSQSASRRIRKLPVLGELKIKEGQRHIMPWQGQYGLEIYFDSHASDAEKKNLWHIMKTTINRLMLHGFASHVTSKDIKK